MSAKLVLDVDTGPLERTRADVAVVYFFDSDRPLQSGAGRVDWRLCGQLSELLVAGKLNGESGESVLLQSGRGLAAPLLIGLGLGARNAFDAEACEALGAESARRAIDLGALSLALPLPDPQAGDLELEERVEALVTGALAAVAEREGELTLRLVPPAAELGRARKAVAALVSRASSPSALLEIDGVGRAPTRLAEFEQDLMSELG